MKQRISYTYIYLLILHIYAFINYKFSLNLNFPLIISINLGMIWFIYMGFSGFEENKKKIISILLGFVLASHLAVFLIMYILPETHSEQIIAAFAFLVLGFVLILKYKGSKKLHLLNVFVYLVSSGFYFIKF